MNTNKKCDSVYVQSQRAKQQRAEESILNRAQQNKRRVFLSLLTVPGSLSKWYLRRRGVLDREKREIACLLAISAAKNTSLGRQYSRELCWISRETPPQEWKGQVSRIANEFTRGSKFNSQWLVQTFPLPPSASDRAERDQSSLPASPGSSHHLRDTSRLLPCPLALC